jgi:hypothetical protein
MNEALKTFTDDLAKELKAKLQDPKISEFVSTVKASGDDRTFEVVFSTDDEDRQGDALNQAGWDLTYYNLNPVVLFAHDYGSFPVGIAPEITINATNSTAKGKFAPAGINSQADIACALYQAGILKAVSPGYIQNDDGTRELLEISFCPVPAGRYALSLRQVSTLSSLGVSTRDLVTKGFAAEVTTKAEQIGDECTLEDGSPGTLAEDDDNPGALICQPNESKAQEDTTTNMNEELTKSIKAEQTRHNESVAKSISDYADDTTKSIDEFEKSVDAEHDEHLSKCMKAIDDNYELEDQKKSIDECKTAIQSEHVEHVKCMDKAIDEFKSALADGSSDEDRTKAIDDFTTKSATELTRHSDAQDALVKAEMGAGESDAEKAIKAMGQVADELQKAQIFEAKYAKLNTICEIFYAFTSAYKDESVGVDDLEKLLDEAVVPMKGGKEKSFVSAFIGKSIPTLPATIKEKIDAVITTLEAQTEREATTNDAIASLKELTGSPQEDKGKEQRPAKTVAPKQRSSPPVPPANTVESTPSEFETIMLSRKVLKAVKLAAEAGLIDIKATLREKFPDRR